MLRQEWWYFFPQREELLRIHWLGDSGALTNPSPNEMIYPKIYRIEQENRSGT
jgi:hypothetical protein